MAGAMVEEESVMFETSFDVARRTLLSDRIMEHIAYRIMERALHVRSHAHFIAHLLCVSTNRRGS